MRTFLTLFLLLIIVSCASAPREAKSPQEQRYERLKAEFGAHISENDLRFYATDEDTASVNDILRTDIAGATQWDENLRKNDSVNSTLPDSERTYFFGGYRDSSFRTHWDHNDSVESARELTFDSAVLNIDILAIKTMDGDTIAQRELDERRQYEGNTNGLMTREQLEARIKKTTAEIKVLKARLEMGEH